ncbi:MAG: hypothetical protein SGJ11_05835 [Phycisphaerae bacterium]|nr:hypothetical protein [Phycisphaerae bacterium]
MPHRSSVRRLLGHPAISVSALTLVMTGCAGWFQHALAPDGGEVAIEGLGDQRARLDGVLPFGAYSVSPADATMYVGDRPLAELLAGKVRNGQFLHAQLLWLPLPGLTPVDPTATNVTLRYIVVSDGEVGIYGGAGFAWPRGTPGEEALSLVIQGSSVALLASTEGFVDLLTPAQLTGTVSVALDAAATRQFRRGLNQLVTDALGATRWVDQNNATLSPDQVVALTLPASAASAANIDGSTAPRSGS